MAVYLGFLGDGWAADYVVPRRWLTPSRSRACRWNGVGVVMSRKAGRAGSAGWIWLRQMVPRSASRFWKRAPAGRRGALGSGLGQGPRGTGSAGDPAVPGGLGGGFVVVGEQHGREAVVHVPGDVVRQHPQEHVRTDPLVGAVADGPDVQVGTESAERALDGCHNRVAELLVPGAELPHARVQAAAPRTRGHQPRRPPSRSKNPRSDPVHQEHQKSPARLDAPLLTLVI
jgi:hypothetical protein